LDLGWLLTPSTGFDPKSGVQVGKAYLQVDYATTNGDDMNIEGDYVIFTVPLPVMRCMRFDPPFSPEKNTAVRTVRYVEVTKILLQFMTRWWEKVGRKVQGDSKTGALGLIHERRFQSELL
jgi:monoamine oxidase